MKKLSIAIALLLTIAILLCSCGNNTQKGDNEKVDDKKENSTSFYQGEYEGDKDIDGNSSLEVTDSVNYIKGKYLFDGAFKKMIADPSYKSPGDVIYASPDGNGSGTKDDPYSIEAGIANVKAGMTLCLLGGVYNLDDTIYLSNSGKEDEYITIIGDPGQEVIITTDNKDGEQVLFSVTGSYMIIENLIFAEVTSRYSIGIAMYGGGQSHILIRNNTFRELKTTVNDNGDYGANAVLLMGEESNSINNIYIGNNKVYDNVLGYSEALSTAGNCEYVYVMDNTLDNNTNIGIDFYGNAEYCRIPELDQPRYCIAAGNKVSKACSYYASSAGIYCDGARDVLFINNEITDSQYGIEIGSEERNVDYPVKDIMVKYNKITNSTTCGIRFGGYDLDSSGIVYNVTVEDNELIDNTVELIFGMVDGIHLENNRIVGGKIIGTEGFTEKDVLNVTLKNNDIQSSKPKPIEFCGKILSLEDFEY